VFLLTLAANCIIFHSKIYANNEIAESFFIRSEGDNLSSVLCQVSEHFGIYIVCSDSFKGREISYNIDCNDFKLILDQLSWQLSTSYEIRGGVVYFGGRNSSISVVPSSVNIKGVEKIFDNKAYSIDDKIVIRGDEEEVNRISKSINEINQKKYCKIFFKIFQVSYDDSIILGLDIKKAITYSASWENLINSQFNPIQALAMSFAVNTEFTENTVKSNTLFDSLIYAESGNPSSIRISLVEDKQIYSVSGQSGLNYVSGYNKKETGLILDFTPYVFDSYCAIDIDVEKSEPSGTETKNQVKLNQKIKLKNHESVIACSIKEKSEKITIEKGIPYLCRIPVVGRLFGHNEDRTYNRDIYILISVEF